MLDTITVYDDNGEEAVFYVLEQTQINGNTYLLATENEFEEELEAWIFKQVKTGSDEIYYETIDDDDELEAVSEVFDELLDDYEIEL